MAATSDNTAVDTVEWPESTNEDTFVERLESLRSQLTEDIATQLCGQNYPIHSFYKTYILHRPRPMKAYLQLLLAMVPLVTRSEFLQIFPKGCGGCAVFQFYAIAALNPSLHAEVHNLLKALLFDEHEWILSIIPNVQHMTKMIRKDYRRHEDPFPYVANCLDLAKKNQEGKIVCALGAMLGSEKFLQLMKDHDERAIKVAQQMFNDDQETFFFGFRLSDRLKAI